MSIELTEAVEAAAKARFDAGQAARMDAARKNPATGNLFQWHELTKTDQHAYRVLVLPIVVAARDSIAAQAWDQGYIISAADQRVGRASANPYTTLPPLTKGTK